MTHEYHTLTAVLCCLLFTGFGSAQTLTVGGSCPGDMTFDITGALPNGQVSLLTGDGPGQFIIPVGPCAGTELGLSGNLDQRAVLTADGAGEVSLAANVPQPFCGAWLQALDLGTCGTSNASEINLSEPEPIAVDCNTTSNPLRFRCTVTVDPPAPVEVRYSRVDGMGIERANTSDVVQAVHEVPVLFLSPQRGYTVEATVLGDPDGATATDSFVTGEPPFDIDSWLEIQGASTMGLIGGEIPCDGDAVAVIYDTGTGDLVYYEEIDPNGTLGVLDMVRFTDEQTILGETGDSIVKVDLLGDVLTQFDVDYPGCCNLHHDVFHANGNYYGLYQDSTFGLTLDPVVVLDSEGNELFQWDPREHLPVPDNASGDWLHANTVWIEEDGTALMSWLTRDSVAKLDLNPESPTFLDVLWIMDGNPPDALPADITIDWSGVPGANSFSGQHNFSRRHDGRYMVLDNDHGRGVVFTIDEVNRTATADAVYDTVEAVCGAQGTATDTEAGNALVACNREFMREYDGDSGSLLWEAEVMCANGGGGFLGTGSARWYSLDGWSNAYLPTP